MRKGSAKRDCLFEGGTGCFRYFVLNFRDEEVEGTIF
jgi:hypothetical protein